MDRKSIPDLLSDPGMSRLVELTQREGHSSNPSTPFPKSDTPNLSNPASERVERYTGDMERAKESNVNNRLTLPSRPALRRDQPVPVQQAPQPNAQEDESVSTTDSLSLMQLKRLVSEMPKLEPTPYAFVYADSSTFEQELEEWFSYGPEDRNMLLGAQSSFLHYLEAHRDVLVGNDEGCDIADLDWTQLAQEARKSFIRKLLEYIGIEDAEEKGRSLRALVYVALGCWRHTAGLDPADTTEKSQGKGKERQPDKPGDHSAGTSNSVQLSWIRENVEMIYECGGLRSIYENVKTFCSRERSNNSDQLENDSTNDQSTDDPSNSWSALTLFYVFLEYSRASESSVQCEAMKKEISQLKPNPLVFLTELISRFRWDESVDLPLNKILQLAWKSILMLFGGIADVDRVKRSFLDKSQDEVDDRGRPIITASPLDYHLFRQEISSKYPAFNPPPPLFPLEPDNNSILPPLHKHPSKFAGPGAVGSGPANLQGNGVSILHQPVHIATPAPSPPPSPAGPGGKGGKKQNYQTNQLFPFLYPPLDESSNHIGGRGSTDLQDLLVGRKWEGPDIPASILEAAELFARRMRASRAMKQLWEERVEFMKYERGWEDPKKHGESKLVEQTSGSAEVSQVDVDGEKSKEDIESRLTAVENFYRDALPHIQSLVIVLLKVVLSHVTTMITQTNNQSNLQSGFQPQDPPTSGNGNKSDQNAPESMGHLIVTHLSNEELDGIRTQEIVAKSVSGILLLMLKWFKVSHVLKFEYLSQLLLDSNYIPLILKLLQTQELERIVNHRCDREELSFFSFCRSQSGHGISRDSEAEDDAAPPPVIKLRREDNTGGLSLSGESPHAMSKPPEVDELGFPTSELPAEPITNFSWRNFFASINYLRIMQKICKNKAHRNLLLVQYKSSQFLRKCLKVPQPELRLYTLKLFKNQVPYCGRKWRQNNMRVITAVYLHCRPELRDDWLAGSDVDAEVEEALPLEQALRALTHWHNLRRYADKMGTDQGILEEEQDFFIKELQKMDWGEDLSTGEEVSGDNVWEGPLAVDGW